MNDLINTLISVSEEESSFIQLRKLQRMIQQNINTLGNKLWIFYPLDEIIENFFYNIEGVDQSNNTELKKELALFKKSFGDLATSLKKDDLKLQIQVMNKIIGYYINILDLL